METKSLPQKPTNVQVMIMELFPNDLPDEDLKKIRNVLTKHFAKEATLEAEKFMKSRGKTLKDLEKTTAAINEHRGNYLILDNQ